MTSQTSSSSSSCVRSSRASSSSRCSAAGRGRARTYPDKSHFVVFDCFDGTLLAYFRNTTAITAEPPEADGKTIAQIIEEIWQNRDRDYNIRRLVKRLQRIDKQMSGDARELFARFVPDGDVGRFAEELQAMLRESFTDTMRTLRDKDFQDLLVNYPRPPRTFLVAATVQDEVSSEWLIKGATGQEYKPEDYLAGVRDVRSRQCRPRSKRSRSCSRDPKAGDHEALRELRQALSQTPEHFTEDNLHRAFQVAHHKALVDIISMVKRAALDTSPLYTAEERVNQAVDRVTAGRQLTDEQAKWMDYIRQHLVANLSIDREDFDERARAPEPRRLGASQPRLRRPTR